MPEVCAALQPVLTIWPILYPWPPRPAAWIYLCLCWGRFWFSWYSFISTLSFISWMVGFSCLILRAAAESDRISYCSFTTCQSVNSLSCNSSIRAISPKYLSNTSEGVCEQRVRRGSAKVFCEQRERGFVCAQGALCAAMFCFLFGEGAYFQDSSSHGQHTCGKWCRGLKKVLKMPFFSFENDNIY